MDNIEQLKIIHSTLEYYFSDLNLGRDGFFHDKISAAVDVTIIS